LLPNAALVELGEGIACLPDFLVGDAVEAGTLMQVLSQWRPKKQLWTYSFVYAGNRYALPKVKCFIQTALEEVSRDRRTMEVMSGKGLGRVKTLWRKHRRVATSARWRCAVIFPGLTVLSVCEGS